jgi:hypothetical protein
MKDARTRLLEAEAEKQAKKKVMQTQREMEEREVALEIAEAKGNEDLDEVKAMNTEVIGARVRTLRDRQLQLNRQAAQDNRDREAHDARMLEEGRRRAVQIYRDREEALRDQRRKGGAVIVAQIEERKRVAQVERQRRREECEAMRVANEQAREEDIQVAEEKRKRSSEFLQECLAANAVSLRRKVRDREREIEEAQMMVEYQMEKAAREEEAERQEIERRAQREREIAGLRKQQQRAFDQQAEIDALKARRVEEQKEREAREKEIEDVRRQQQIVEEQRADREGTVRLKQRRLVELAKLEKMEFDRAAAAQAETRKREQEAEAQRRERNAQYRQSLKDQIQEREDERNLKPIVNLDEQTHMHEQNQDYLDKLERIRQMKLAKLRQEGVPEKYLVDLQKMTFVLK